MSLHKHHGADRVVEGELPRAHAAMNITPMIDVLLVLLVIFMVTLPLNQRGIDIACRQRRRHEPAPAPHRARVHERQAPLDQPAGVARRSRRAAAELFEDRTDKTMFVMAAGSLRYGDIVGSSMPPREPASPVGIVTERMRGVER